MKYFLNIINKKVSKYEMILNKVTRVCSRVEVLHSKEVVTRFNREATLSIAWPRSSSRSLTTSSLVLRDFSDSPLPTFKWSGIGLGNSDLVCRVYV